MKLPVWACSVLFAALLAVQGWSLAELVAVKVAIAENRCRCAHLAAQSEATAIERSRP